MLTIKESTAFPPKQPPPPKPKPKPLPPPNKGQEQSFGVDGTTVKVASVLEHGMSWFGPKPPPDCKERHFARRRSDELTIPANGDGKSHRQQIEVEYLLWAMINQYGPPKKPQPRPKPPPAPPQRSMVQLVAQAA